MNAEADARSARRAGGLTPGTRWLLVGLTAAAVAVAAAVVLIDTHTPSLTAIAVLTAAIVAGEAFNIDLPFRRAGSARYGLGDLSLTAGLLLLSGTEVLVAAALAMMISGFIDRPPLVRRLFNLSQYVLATGVAAGVVELLVSETGQLSLGLFGAAALGILLFTLINVVAVAGGIALNSRESWIGGLQRIMPVGLLIGLGNAALGLIAVAVLESHPWALPAVAVPLVLMFSASRQEVRAKIDRERSEAYVTIEQHLAETVDAAVVAGLLADGARRILGCSAAVWRDGRWIGEVPEGSTECPVDPGLAVPLVALGPGLGPATDGRCIAVGLGGGVLVAWQGEIGVDRKADEWLERLAQSGRAHFERAEAASALAHEQATLRAVVDGTKDGICVFDAQGVVRLWNPAMARLSGAAASAALGRGVWHVLGAGPWTTDGVYDVPRDDGERVWRLSVSSLRDAGHGAMRVAVVHDVTTERRVARMKDDMLAVVSHELRTPLTPIKASAQLLRRRWERMEPTSREDLLERIEERADHLTRLVGDILLVGQLSASSRLGLEVAPTETDLAGLLHEIVAAQRTSHPTHDLALTTPDVVTAHTDPVRVRQIVDNLIDNACKFSDPGSTVDVSVAVHDGSATVSVADTGRGIPREDLERVFDRFERVEDPLIMTTSGAGLGLYIVREVSSALGGNVAIDSALGRGTTVSVHLPLHLPDPRLAQPHGPLPMANVQTF